jgi:hypothetical protein
MPAKSFSSLPKGQKAAVVIGAVIVGVVAIKWWKGHSSSAATSSTPASTAAAPTDTTGQTSGGYGGGGGGGGDFAGNLASALTTALGDAGFTPAGVSTASNNPVTTTANPVTTTDSTSAAATGTAPVTAAAFGPTANPKPITQAAQPGGEYLAPYASIFNQVGFKPTSTISTGGHTYYGIGKAAEATKLKSAGLDVVGGKTVKGGNPGANYVRV